jgi:hypothetical protein
MVVGGRGERLEKRGGGTRRRPSTRGDKELPGKKIGSANGREMGEGGGRLEKLGESRGGRTF